MSPALVRSATLLVAGTTVLALTGCGAGFRPLTYEERNSSTASELAINALEVRDVAVEAPEELVHDAGETVEMSLVVVNPTAEEDRLVEVTTDAAASVELVQDGRTVDAIEVPAAGAAMGDVSVRLVDTTRELRAGEYVEVTMMFEGNGSETFLVPVRSPDEPGEPEHSELVHQDSAH